MAALSLARNRRKYITLYFMWLGILCMCVRSEHARPRVPVCACTWTHVSRPRYSSGLYVRTYAHVCTTYRSLVRAFVCVYTRPSPSCIRVSGSVSSSRVAFRASISAFPPRFSLIFCKNLSLRFHVLKIFLFFKRPASLFFALCTD